MRKDLTFIVNGWEYDPDDITVRSVLGIDGREKIQMRLNLGVLQMESRGRPDGKFPHGYSSLLEYFEEQYHLHNEIFNHDLDFALGRNECVALRQESMQYYYRYLSLFHLERYQEALRDIDHNLRIFDFVHRYAESTADKMALERLRPDILLMRTRAKASIHLNTADFDAALDEIDRGIRQLQTKSKRNNLYHSPDGAEVLFLRNWRKTIEAARPLSAEERTRRDLQSELQRAVAREDYELAALLRDQLKAIIT